MSRIQWFMFKLMQVCDAARPYVRIMRVLVTIIAPIILFLMYVLHKSCRNKNIQVFMQKLSQYRSLMALLKMIKLDKLQLSTTNGIMELAQINDMFWMRLT